MTAARWMTKLAEDLLFAGCHLTAAQEQVVERVLQAALAAEREACAQLALQLGRDLETAARRAPLPNQRSATARHTAEQIATAIRERHDPP